MSLSSADKEYLESVLRQIPGYNPWDLAGDSWLDHEAAAAAINFFADHLKHVEGEARGREFVLRGWQAAIVGNAFGWKRRDAAGRTVRRFRYVFVYVPRGNGKTPLIAGFVLCGYFLDVEPGAQNYLAAGRKEQAGALFRNAKGFLDQDEDLLNLVRVYGGETPSGPRVIIKHDDPMAFIKVVAADAAGSHGGIPHITCIDELHAQKNRDFVDVCETAMSKETRSQPMLIMLTTADYDGRVSICNEKFEYAKKVRDNGGDPAKPGFDPSFLPVLYYAEDDEDWLDDDVLARVNPNVGHSVSLESLIRARKKAQETPAFENEFRRLHLNQRTSKNVRIMPIPDWNACPPLDVESLKGKVCIAGMDLASIEDLASYALLFPLENEELAILVRTFCPEVNVRARAKQFVPYVVWHRQGHLIATKGNQIDYQAIIDQFNEDAKTYRIQEVACDPHGATHLLQTLEAQHGEGFAVTVTQTMNVLSAPFKHLIRLTKLRKIRHGNNPVFSWAASNVAGFYRGKIPEGGKLEDHLDKVPVMPSKQDSADKIDPITATVNGLARLLVNPHVVAMTEAPLITLL